MVNFGPLAADIGPVVWGTPANFNGFRLLAALLQILQQWASAKLCGVEQRAPPIFGRAAITLGIGPHSSFTYLLESVEAMFGLFRRFVALCKLPVHAQLHYAICCRKELRHKIASVTRVVKSTPVNTGRPCSRLVWIGARDHGPREHACPK